MMDETFFTRPTHPWQKRYEALRASFVERVPARAVAERFGYTVQYVHLLRHNFKKGRIDFRQLAPEGETKWWRVTAEVRQKICEWRGHRLSAREIAQLLDEEGFDISVRTVERVLADEGFGKLPRRTRLKIELTVKGARVPERSEAIDIGTVQGKRFDCAAAGVFLFAPFLAKLDVAGVVRSAGLPGTKSIPAVSYFLSFLAAKLLGVAKHSHIDDHAFDPGLGLFAGLNVLPKCTAMSTYSYSLDEVHLSRLQKAFVRQVSKLGLYDGKIVNLDFHTVPHYGDESVLETHWASGRGKRMKGALTLFAQDARSKLILYTAADIKRCESDEQVLEFLRHWRRVQRGVKPTFVFDAKFTSHRRLAELHRQGVKFITLRRRGKRLLESVETMGPWKGIHVPHAKRKYPNLQVFESLTTLRDYPEEIRQVVLRGNAREKPAFIITNDLHSPVELVVADYTGRWRVENGIAEAVKFFHLNALSSPILVKVHFDVVTTMIADTLYSMLAGHLRGFEDCDAPKLYRHFVRGKGVVEVRGSRLTVIYPRRAHNPILRNVLWNKLPMTLPGIKQVKLTFKFP